MALSYISLPNPVWLNLDRMEKWIGYNFINMHIINAFLLFDILYRRI